MGGAVETGEGGMTFDLSEKELKIIEQWYNSAAGESASGMACPDRSHVRTDAQDYFDEQYKRMVETKAFVDKLGFSYHWGDRQHLVHHSLIPRQEGDEK